MFAAFPRYRLILPADARKEPDASRAEGGVFETHYSRRSSDEIEVKAVVPAPGFIRVLESYDPGWKATVNGAAVPVVPANEFEMAVPVQDGSSVVRVRYETPGRAMGTGLSLLSLALLGALVASHNRVRHA